jgi:hypothetical protein
MFHTVGGGRDLRIGGGGFAHRRDLVGAEKGASEQSLDSNRSAALSGFNRAGCAATAFRTLVGQFRPSMRFCVLRHQVVSGS